MPIFEYKCERCGHVMEFLEKRAGKHKHVCEKCGGSKMQKLLSGFSVGQSGSKPGSYESQSGSSCPTGTCPLS